MVRMVGKWMPGLTAAAVLILTACGDSDAREGSLTGSIEIDGSSTVYPISEAVAEEYAIEYGAGVRVTIGFSGTGGGFKRFCAGETEISNASRAIKQEERELCEANGIDFIELPVAIDGLAVVVNPQNTFAECLTVEELRNIWQPGSSITTWSQVRDEWPSEPLKLYGPGTNSGTFDYFTEVIAGQSGASRSDFTASEDDNVLVQGVIGDRNALGYFGYAYYAENRDRMKVLGVDNGQGCVTPTEDTVRAGEYTPLSRPLFIYVTRQALARPEVEEFVRYYMQAAPELVPQVGYVPLQDAEYRANLNQIGPG